MNADAFRQLYDYHFSENRKLWDSYIMGLSQEQFTHHINYSMGSVRNHIVHLMNVDEIWFSDLRGVGGVEQPKLTDLEDRDLIRQRWDRVEQEMREYLAGLRDDMLFTKPFPEGEDEDLILWQVLLHVVNHGTDHRAQLLRILHDLGAKTPPQDFVFYVYEANAANAHSNG
jgi:uncharacterized damage-inducible protein DinB